MKSVLLLGSALALLAVMPATAGQAPKRAQDPDIAISHRDRVYAAEQFSNTVSVTDPVDNRLLGFIKLGDPAPGNLSPLYRGQLLVHGLGASPDHKTLAVVSIGSNAVTFIDTATNTVKHTTYFGRSPHEAFFTPDGREVWVTVRGEDYISVLDAQTYAEIARIVTPAGPGMTIFSPDGRYGYVCSSFNPETVVIEVAAREIVGFDFGAITLYDCKRARHIICRVLGGSPERFEGFEFGDNAGLCSMVVKNKHFLPAGEDLRERDTVVFTRKLRLRGMESLMVLPLIVQDSPIGTFVLAARAAGRFPKKTREMLGVISNQVAVSIENAKIYKRMEEMATTDGLTGLPNHRTFQARFSEMLARAERTRKPLALVITDVDKFKAVNDTYGHPVGDLVLKRVARVLAEQVRKVDLVARYGGEEFAMVLEETGDGRFAG